jgi:proteasome lid subunit RPN8/RPN11
VEFDRSAVIEQLPAILEHAKSTYPSEACGLVIVRKGRARYVPCRNLSATPWEHFVIDPVQVVEAEEEGEIIAVVHSHPTGSPKPQQPDLVGCESTGIPWLIVNPKTEAYHYFTPTGYVAPIVGRQFCFGTLDCYALARDWYKQVRGVDLPDFERHDKFWLRGENLFLDNFAKAGFVSIPFSQVKEGDAILQQIASPLPNHCGILLGDGTFLHHAQGRLSSRDVYGDYWRKVTTHFLRFQGLTP